MQLDIFDQVIGPYRPIGWAIKFWPVLVISFGVALLATAMCKKIAIAFNIVDRPDALIKTHKQPVAYLGGVGILFGMIVGMLAAIYYLNQEAHLSEILEMLFGIMAGGAIACAVGVLDDILNIKPWQKLLGQSAAALALLLAGIRPGINYYTNMLGFSISPELDLAIGSFVVLVFVLGATNSLNLLDGLDGLCAGVTGIIALGMLVLAVHLATWKTSETRDAVRVVTSLALIGGVAGFLPFNRHPAKIFMGDAGSLLLGFVVAAMMMLFAARNPRWLLASIMVFGLPILDTAVAIIRRLINKRPIFVSDRGHIYDQMMDRGFGLRKTVLICYLLAAMYAVIGLAMSQIRTRYALVVYIFIAAISAIVVWKKGYLKMEGVRGAIKKPGPTKEK